jgi:hypothetical protein
MEMPYEVALTQFDIGGELVSLAQTAEMLSLVASSIFDFATNIRSGQEPFNVGIYIPGDSCFPSFGLFGNVQS